MLRNIWQLARHKTLSSDRLPFVVAAATTVGVLGIAGIRHYSSSSENGPTVIENDPEPQKPVRITGANSLYHTISRRVAQQSYEKRPSTATDPSLVTLIDRENVVISGEKFPEFGFKRLDLCASPRLNTAPLDRFSTFFTDKPYPWSFFGLFESYHGMDISHYLCDMLPRAIAVTLGSLVRIGEDGKLPSEPPTALDASTGQNVPAIHGIDSNAIDMGIKRTFLITDNCALYEGLDYANRPGVCKTTLIPHLGMALSGASALVTFYEPSSQLLKVALTGNSGAVLGRPVQREDGTQEYDVYPLTSPHTASNPTEMARLNAMLRSDAQAICRSVSDSESAGANTADNSVDMDTDPEVESIFNKLSHSLYDPNGKIFGTGVTRAFGLAAYKWSYELQRYIHSDYLGYNDIPLPSSDTVNTPSYPYLTAEPEITTVQVQPGDVLVMGTSGLWKALSNEEVVGLVGAWANLSEDARIDIEQHDGVLVTSEQQLSQEVGTGEGLEPPSSLTSSTVLPSRIFTFKDLPLRHTSSPSSPSPILSSPASLSSLPFSASPPHPLSTNCLAAQNSQHSLANTHPPSHTKSASLSPPISLDESQPLSLPHPPSPPPLSTQSKPLYHHQSKSLEKQFVCIDNNAARHIVRNALGGLDDDLVTTVINLDEYRAQKVRDSINVIVVFF